MFALRRKECEELRSAEERSKARTQSYLGVVKWRTNSAPLRT